MEFLLSFLRFNFVGKREVASEMSAAFSSYVFLYNYSNSQIIHKENTKKINVSSVFGNQIKKTAHFCTLNFSI